MHKLIYHNDSVLNIEDSFIPSGSSGVLYGWGIFTTIKIHKGKPLFFDKHWERIERDSKRVGIKLKYNYKNIKDSIELIISENSVFYGKMRITIIKGEGGLWGDKGINDSLLIFTDDLKEDDKELKITISPFKINSHSPITGVKSTCYINNILSLKEIKNKGFDEAMVLNEDGYIAEAIMANIFWINNGIVYTPSLNTGCLPGITRDIILEIIRDLGIYIKEGEFGLNEIKDAKEIFLTSCIKGVKPVRYINDRAFEIDNNSLTSIIINRFKEIINEEYICGYDKGNGFCR